MFGFQQNQVTLQDAFKFSPYAFPNLVDNHLKHVNLQNGKLWALTDRQQIVVKADRSEGTQPPSIDEHIIKRKNIKKMFVDREGVHCIMLAEHELYYNNWQDSHLIQFDQLCQQKNST